MYNFEKVVRENRLLSYERWRGVGEYLKSSNINW